MQSMLQNMIESRHFFDSKQAVIVRGWREQKGSVDSYFSMMSKPNRLDTLDACVLHGGCVAERLLPIGVFLFTNYDDVIYIYLLTWTAKW